MSFKIFGKKFFVYLCVLVIAFFVFKACTKKKNTDFPKLKNGQYGGEINLKGKKDLFYLAKSDYYTIAIVGEGNIPRKSDLPNLLINNNYHRLVGSKVDKKYEGEIFLDKKEIGKWSLKKIKPIEVTPSDEIINSIKSYYVLRNQAKSLREETTDYATHIENLKNAMPNIEKIKNVALSEIDDLNYSIDEKKQIRKKIKSDIKNYVVEIEQLQRITSLGRVVDLARRTTKREDRWYLANWGDESLDQSQLDIADSLGVDPSKLEEKLKLAEEYANLKNSISFEARKIEEIKNAKAKPIQPKVVKPVEINKPKDKSFWNKFGDIFGL